MASSAADVTDALDQRQQAQMEQAATQAAMQQSSPEEIRKELIDKLAETQLKEPSRDLLKNLISPDWVLANLDSQDYHEFKHRLEATKLRFFDMHPAPECQVTGDDRAYINGRNDYLTPLSPQEKEAVNEFFDGIRLRLTRSKNMEQQRLLQTRIVESSVNRPETDQSKDGLIRRWFGK